MKNEIVYETKEWDKFSNIAENRLLNKNNLRRLEKSIKEENLLQSNPIIVNEKMEIINGQHRRAVAKKLQLPLYYVVVEGATIDTTIILNTQRPWGTTDYIRRFTVAGNQDYKTLSEFVKYYRLPVSLSAKLLYGITKAASLGGGGFTDVINEGKFEVRNLKKASAFADRYKEIYDLIKKPFARSRQFVVATMKFMESPHYEHEVFLHKLQRFPQHLERQESVNDYLREFESLYYRNSKAGEKPRFF